MSAASSARRLGLKALRRIASSPALARAGGKERLARLLYLASRETSRLGSRIARTGRPPARQRTAPRADLFDLTPTEEQELLRGAVREVAERVVRPAAKEADSACAVPEEVRSAIGELGLLALGLPEELGGPIAERSAVTSVLALEALAWGDMGIAAAELGPAAFCTALSLWGDGDQQAAYLPDFAGEHPPVAAFALAERNPLDNPLWPRTGARRRGEGWVLEGEKALVLRGGQATVALLSARTERGPALFLVELPAAGATVSPMPAMGLRAAQTARLTLEGVAVGADALVGEGDPKVFSAALARSRIAWAAAAVGTCQAVLDYVIPYVKERKAFGEPIANRQAVAFTVANIAIELEGLRLLCLRAASRADQGLPFAREAALARAFAARRAPAIGSDGVQLLGGHGYVKEHPVERWYRDLRAVGTIEGGLLV